MEQRYDDEHFYSHQYQRSTSPIDYDALINKPSIDGVTLEGDMSAEELGLARESDIPTKTSDLHNDSGFITASDVPTKTSELTNDSGFITASDVPTKTSELTNDSGFIIASDVPTKTSDLTNDSGFITASDVPTKTSELTNDSVFITASDVPTKTSDLTNDSGFISSTDLSNGYMITAWFTSISFNAPLKNIISNIQTQLSTVLNGLSSNEYITLEQVIITNLVNITPERKVVLKKGDTVPNYRLQGFSFGTNELVFVDVNNKCVIHLATINDRPAADYNDDYSTDNTSLSVQILYNKYKKGV
jgi:adhesin HecA-like repeat protein